MYFCAYKSINIVTRYTHIHTCIYKYGYTRAFLVCVSH